ncbi:MAG TPA: choice-of-anchor Q domain-containing protein [Solirubrobacterales bacterium]|nr:choice-of-anchor Q domain-containing protein [Solirubrobacterales bacterium]
MRSRLIALPLVLALVALLLGAATASAQTYTVTRTDDPIPGACEPSDCSLREAVMASNNSTGVDDVVVVPANPSPYIIQYEFLSFFISDETEVRGAGANQTVVKGDGQESIFAVGAGIKATLAGMTITNGTSAIQSNSELVVRDVSIEGNEWNGGTAGIITNGPLTVESSFLGFNRTNTLTSGVIFSNAPVTVINSTIAHNTSKEGQGAIGGNSSVTIVNSAIVSNRSETAPAAAVGGVPLSVRNSVFADNRDATGLHSCASAGPLTSFGGNVSDDASCGTGATDKPNVNPLLGTLALHGGTTKVYDLLAGSPAIDAASQCPAVDQRGVARPQGAACDSGPYELVPTPQPAADREFSMKVGKKLRLRKKTIRVRLTCPASEVSSPCRGKVSVADPPLVFRGAHTLQARPLEGKFTIRPGKTKWLPLREPRGRSKRLPDGPGKWKVGLVVLAEDGAGNEWKYLKKKAPLIGAKPKRG